MREIKFDLIMKNKNTGYLHHKKYGLQQLMIGIDKLFDIENYVTVANRQYIGRIDKNGAECYEGDIVKAFHAEYEEFNTAAVEFINGIFTIGRYWKDGIHDWYSMEQYDSFELEIIGNIYEDKHLLEDK